MTTRNAQNESSQEHNASNTYSCETPMPEKPVKRKKEPKAKCFRNRWRLFDKALAQVRDAFADVPSDKLNKIIKEAVASASRREGT